MEMEDTGKMKKVMMCLALALALSVNAFALEVPTDRCPPSHMVQTHNTHDSQE